jgi:RecG-like helicase
MPYLAKSLTKGRRYRAYGRMKIGLYGREMTSPKLEPILQGKPLPYYVPVYRVAAPLTQRAIASAVAECLPLCDQIPDIMPQSIKNSFGLLNQADAVRIMHMPQNAQSLALARKSIAFSELTVFRLALSGMRTHNKKESAIPLTLKNTGIKGFFQNLPFSLTKAQQRAVKEIFADLGEYAKTVDFVPFKVLKTIVDEMVEKSQFQYLYR